MTHDFLKSLAKRRRKAIVAAQQRQGSGPDAACHKWLGAAGAARADACVITMMKDDDDVIGAYLSWHLRLGFRHFIIFDNGSVDGSRDIVLATRRRWPDAEILLIDDPAIAYYQDRKMTGLALLAEKLWPSVRWIFPIDTDEFLCLRDDLARAIARLEGEAVDLAYIPYYNANQLADGGALDEGVPFYERQLWRRGRIEDVKVVFRAGRVTRLHMGNHDVDTSMVWERRGDGLAAGMVYRHYPSRSITHLRRKVVNGGRALAATNYPQMFGWHWREWYARYLAEGDAALHSIYDGMRIPPEEAVLAPFPLGELLDLPSEETPSSGGNTVRPTPS